MELDLREESYEDGRGVALGQDRVIVSNGGFSY